MAEPKYNLPVGTRFLDSRRQRIVSTDPATIDKHIADVEAARIAKETQEAAEREAEERAKREHEATPLHQLADRIANAKGCNWDWCAGWEPLGMDLLREIEARLVVLGKLKHATPIE